MNTRRPTPSVALIPKVEGRVSNAEKKLPSPRHSSPDARRPGVPRGGMTLIELGIVMGIVSVLLALVLGLARHVNTVVKIRRAQADLGEWHESLNRWILRFGEYPHAVIDTKTGSIVENLIMDNQPLANLKNLLDRCEIRFAENNNRESHFRSFLTSDLSHLDPWGTPYVYIPSGNAKDYTLYSCGPDAKSEGIPAGTSSTPDPTLDDIYFER